MIQAASITDAARNACFAELTGEVTSVGQKSLTANGPYCRVGDICEVKSAAGQSLAEVVAVGRERVELLPLAQGNKPRTGDRVLLSQRHSSIPAGDGFAGRAIDAFGEPIDGGKPIIASASVARDARPSMSKTIVSKRVATGIPAIDSLLPVAQGQRVGIFAASGVGKTTLVEQIASRIQCDKIVVCLIGERGREIERMWSLLANRTDATPVTIVAATSDESPSVRARAMQQALALCEEWRERGEHVVLFVDSITRLAMALREIGLVAGEPPALRSYTPNVFSVLPECVERCGAIKGKGAITAIFTVLSETDDVDDPIVETMKSLLDGHIVLSRNLAERGHYPAIDIRASVSRVADQVLDADVLAAALRVKKLVATFEDARAMIESGLYHAGASQEVDEAINLRPVIDNFLTGTGEATGTPEDCDAALQACLPGGAQ